jgi:hypothetical protein
MAKAGIQVTDLRGLVETPGKRTAKSKKGQPNEGVQLVPQSVQEALAGSMPWPLTRGSRGDVRPHDDRRRPVACRQPVRAQWVPCEER